VEQLSRACAVSDQLAEALARSQDTSVTLWTKTAPAARRISLRANAQTQRGVQTIMASRYQDLAAEGLGDVALAVLQGARITARDQHGADVMHPQPERTAEDEGAERSTRDDDAGETGEEEFFTGDEDDDDRLDDHGNGPDPRFF
jgi:hypothetical protein